MYHLLEFIFIVVETPSVHTFKIEPLISGVEEFPEYVSFTNLQGQIV